MDAAHRPIDVVPWTRAVVLGLAAEAAAARAGGGGNSGGGGGSRVEVLAFYPDVTVRSAAATHRVPAVLRARVLLHQHYHHSHTAGGSGGGKKHKDGGRRSGGAPTLRPPPASRRNVIARDGGCVYCGARADLTIDHVTPLCRGGGSDWSNVVAACARCNQKKGARTLAELGWRLPRPPRAPARGDLMAARVGAAAPPEWRDWLPAAAGGEQAAA